MDRRVKSSSAVCGHGVAGSFGVNYLFEQRSLELWLINGGYNVVISTVKGAIIGAMS